MADDDDVDEFGTRLTWWCSTCGTFGDDLYDLSHDGHRAALVASFEAHKATHAAAADRG
jgi:hypothetical protein